MNIADQIDQLNASRLKIQSGKFNLPRSNSGGVLGNEMPWARKEIPKEEAYSKYAGASRKVEIDAIESMGLSRGYLSLGFRGRAL